MHNMFSSSVLFCESKKWSKGALVLVTSNWNIAMLSLTLTSHKSSLFSLMTKITGFTETTLHSRRWQEMNGSRRTFRKLGRCFSSFLRRTDSKKHYKMIGVTSSFQEVTWCLSVSSLLLCVKKYSLTQISTARNANRFIALTFGHSICYYPYCIFSKQCWLWKRWQCQ